jgi:probable O-glycosylation ligase (exosortase A-associated)
MRGYLFFSAFLLSLPFVFVSPFNGVLLWYAFSLGNFHRLVWGVFTDLYYAYIIAGLTCFSWLISREKKQLPLTPLVVLTLLFAAWITVTTFAAAESGGSPVDLWSKWTTVEKVLFMCLVGYALTTTRERVNQLIWVVVLAIGVWGVKGAIFDLLHGGTARLFGPDGTAIGDNNDFGLALIMLLPLLFYLWHDSVNRHLRRALVIMGFLVALAVLFTYSRGALIGLCAMATVFWLRSRAKLAMGLLIVAVASFAYIFAPALWFNRMETIETYEQDGSAMTRIYIWKVGLRIAEEHPIVGGGFRATYYPARVNAMLSGSGLPALQTPRAEHSIYLDALSEHGWVGLALFLMIAVYSWYNCSWLMRQTRGRPDLAWGNLLGRMGQGSLVGYWTAGAFVSQAYLDEYWCVIFILDAARRLVAKEIANRGGTFARNPSMRLPVPQPGIGTAAVLKSGIIPNYAENRS